MIINAYDTTIGKPLRISEKIANIIKTLSVRNDLLPSTKQGVFYIDNTIGEGIPIFPVPLTMSNYLNQTITVYDERPMRNNSNRVISLVELNIIRLTAYLQQDVASGSKGVIDSSKFIIIRGVIGAIAETLGSRGLTLEEINAIKIILTHYYNGLFEGDSPELGYLSTNVIHTVFNIDRAYSQYLIDEIGYIKDPVKLVEVIKSEPSLYKLKTLTLTDFINLAGRITTIGLGTKVTNCIIEAPCLACGFIYGTVTNQFYSKSKIGLQLNPKFQKDMIEAFIRNINSNYDLTTPQ